MILARMRDSRTYVASVEHEAVVNVFPAFLGDKRLKILRYFREIGMVRKIEAQRKASHVRISRNTLPNAIELAEDHVRCLIRDTRKPYKFLFGLGHLSAELVAHEIRCSNDMS